MSLSLLQGYSSPEEEEEEDDERSSSDDQENHDVSADRTTTNNFKIPLFDPPNPSPSSSLPSAFLAFSEISGPPQFLNNSVGESASAEKDNDGQLLRHGHRRNQRDKNDMPAGDDAFLMKKEATDKKNCIVKMYDPFLNGAVMEAKAELVGIRERVSSEKVSVSSNAGGKRVATATNPNAQDAADLLRMCVQCGIPKTFNNARGMVCPVCGDRPVADTDEASKKKGSMIKEKEKNKRMKGQSSHATWKSETEMHLRQQFD